MMRVPSPGQIPGSVLEPFQKPSDQARNFIALRIHGLFLYSETEGQGKTLKNGEVSWPTTRFVLLKARWFSNLSPCEAILSLESCGPNPETWPA